VATLNPDHLFEQAERLVAPPPAGPPRQVDLRRAISAAYYGLFHFCLIAAADEFVDAAIELQEKRHLVDHNPQPRFRTSDAKLAVSTARSAVQRFEAADEKHRKAFLTLLICPPR